MKLLPYPAHTHTHQIVHPSRTRTDSVPLKIHSNHQENLQHAGKWPPSLEWLAAGIHGFAEELGGQSSQSKSFSH